MGGLEFDAEVAARLEAVYATRDVVLRRRLVRDALAAQPGDVVADVGCGPGFYVADLLHEVGDGGRVVGVEPAEAMRTLAAGRVAGRAGAEVREGEATSLPVGDASVDRAVAVQVLEYVPDVAAALRELHRVVRGGGRVVLWDVDWSTLSWHAQDEERMARVCALWDRHLVHRALPRTLALGLREAGFEDVEVQAHTFATQAMDPEAYGGSLPLMVVQFVSTLGESEAAEAQAWLQELRELDARGAYFFSVTQFCFTATRPA